MIYLKIKNLSKIQKGILLAFMTAIISGFSIFLSKFAIDIVKDGTVYTTLKNLAVAVFLIGILIVLKDFKKIRQIKAKDWTKLWLVGIIGGSVPFVLFFEGLARTTAVSGAFIHKTMFIWVAILAIIFLKEKLGKAQIFAFLVLLSGVVFLGQFNTWKIGSGELMIFGATMLWAIENIIAKKVLKDLPARFVAGARMIIGSIILVAIVLISGKASLVTNLNITQFFWLVVMGLFLLGYVMTWYAALKRAPASLVASILVISVPITTALSAVFITHQIAGKDILSSMLIIIGISLLTYFYARRNLKVRQVRLFTK